MSWSKHLKVSNSIFIKFVAELEARQHGWSLEFEVIVFLMWLASGASYRKMSLAVSIPGSGARTITKKSNNAKNYPTYIELEWVQ